MNLSADVGQASAPAAVGVAAHEAGHAIQDARHYRPMRIRQSLFAVIVLFQLVTLPVEFDASKRALAALEGQGVLAADEVPGARAVLNAAAHLCRGLRRRARPARLLLPRQPQLANATFTRFLADRRPRS